MTNNGSPILWKQAIRTETNSLGIGGEYSTQNSATDSLPAARPPRYTKTAPKYQRINRIGRIDCSSSFTNWQPSSDLGIPADTYHRHRSRSNHDSTDLPSYDSLDSLLRPAFGGIFPSRRSRRLGCNVDRRLRDADRLLGGSACQSGLVVNLCAGVFVIRQKWRGHAQCFHFLFQPGEFELFLPQNLVNILHSFGTCGTTQV